MIRRLHRKLTLLCGIFTSCILLCMSAAFLFVSENSQRQNSFLSFSADMNALLASLEEQSVLSHSWLGKLENGKYRIYLLDNGRPLLFHALSLSEREQNLIDAALSHYEKLQPSLSAPNSFHAVHAEFPWSGRKGNECPLHAASHYISCMTWLKNAVPVTAVVLAPQDLLLQRLTLQRLLLAAIDLVGIAAFFAFSWFFTGRLLKPVQENHQRQADFIASASHELRTPLSAILASADACKIAPTQDRARFFAAIKREGKRMQGLLSDMLLLAGDPSVPMHLSKALTDPETLLLNQYESFEAIMQKEQLTFSVALPEEKLPFCLCEEEKIAQVISVFLQNAVSYTPAGGLVCLGIRQEGRHILIFVSDTGPGVPDAEKDRIFERFYRGEKARSRKDHFGLGLCIAADIAKAHRGRISVTDNQPSGSIFTLELPL